MQEEMKVNFVTEGNFQTKKTITNNHVVEKLLKISPSPHLGLFIVLPHPFLSPNISIARLKNHLLMLQSFQLILTKADDLKSSRATTLVESQ